MLSDDIENVYPKTICHKCYNTINNVIKRMTSTTLCLCMNWKPHCEECFCCQQVKKLSKGLNVAKLFKHNKKLIGRPDISKKVWSFSMIAKIKSSIVIAHDSDIDIEELKNQFNPHLSLCQCNLCSKVPKQPVTLKRCEHLFCFFCLVETIKVKKLNETFCPKCKEPILPTDLVTSVKTNSLLNILTIECICKKKFNVMKEYDLYTNHKSICIDKSIAQTASLLSPSISLFTSNLASSSFTVTSSTSSLSTLLNNNISEIFNLTVDDNIPRIVEDAALHVLKQKMAKDGKQVVEFKSGGPRPVLFSLAPKAYVSSDQASTTTVRVRNASIKRQLKVVSGTSNDAICCQSSKLLNSFQAESKGLILDNLNTERVVISATNMVAMKADLCIPWEKLKTISRWLKSFNINTASHSSQRIVAEKLSGDDLIVENAPFTFEKKEKGTFEIKYASWGYIENLPMHILRHLDQLESCKRLHYHKFIPDKEIQIKIGGDYGGGSFKMTYQVANTLNPNSKDNTIVFSIFEAKDYRINVKVAMSRFEKQIEDLQEMKYKDNNIRVFVFGDYQFLCALYGISGASGRHCCLFCYATASDMNLGEQKSSEIKDRTLEDLLLDHEKFIENGGLKKNVKNFNNVITKPILKIPLDQVSLPSLHMALGIYLNFFNLFEEEVHQLDIMIAAEAVKSRINFSEEYPVFVSKQKQLLNLQTEILNFDNQIQEINDVILLAAVNNSDNLENFQSLYSKEIELLNSEKAKKKSSILQLCNCIPKLVHDEGYSGTNMHQFAVEISKKNINDLMKFYRLNWPEASVTPKLHMLEHHAIPFMQKWGAGFGFYGEQGGESIHMEFNKLKTTYQSIPCPTLRLKSILKSHYQKTNPENMQLKPCVKKRKKIG
ncbi:uncharacterized protein LOC136085802 isoform X2 [Hydra vulgaris]|uniref:Uncharacterized protein LOC136085802 isoform X2 n=2 Tax=Hydra vulgaris TaxID=6087 RepID=A0ABM4CND8_HYDVU